VIPNTTLTDASGAVVDWKVGYEAPAAEFVAWLDSAVKGIDTVKALNARLQSNPNDATAAFKLALKYDDALRGKEALENWRKGLAADPNGVDGSVVDPNTKLRASYPEYASYRIATLTMREGGKPNPEPLRQFLKAYPNSALQTRAALSVATLLASTSKDEAAAYYESLTNRYPGDTDVLEFYLAFLARTKTNPARAKEIAQRLVKRNQFKSPIESFYKTLAEQYLAEGDADSALHSYGPDVMKSRTRIMALDLTRYAQFWGGRGTNRESAVEAIDMALALCPPDTAQAAIVTQAADALLKFGMEEKALALIGPQYAKQNWSDSSRLWSFADFWTNQGKRLEEALAAALRLTEMNPLDYTGWKAVGSAYAKQRKFAEALKAADKAVQLAEEDKEWVESWRKGIMADAEKAKVPLPGAPR